MYRLSEPSTDPEEVEAEQEPEPEEMKTDTNDKDTVKSDSAAEDITSHTEDTGKLRDELSNTENTDNVNVARRFV